MGNKNFLIGLIILLAVAGWEFHRFTEHRSTLNDVRADISIDAVDLYNQYQSNETTADKKYLDKIIDVKGIVTDIEQTDSTLSVELKGSDSGGINCGVSVDGIDKRLPFQKGSMITLKGKCSGFVMDVNMVDCIIEK